MQAKAQALVELQERLFKARTPKSYLKKFYMDCYQFC